MNQSILKGLQTKKMMNQGKRVRRTIYKGYILFAVCAFSLRLVFGLYESMQIVPVLQTENSVNRTISLDPQKITPEAQILANGAEFGAVMVKLAQCESTMNQYAVHANTNGTIDKGIFQINSVHKKTVSDACMFDIPCASRWTLEKLRAGQGHIWTCWSKI